MSRPYKKNQNKGPASKFSSPCKYYLRGSCSNQRCPYLHVRQHNVVKSSDSSKGSTGSANPSSSTGAASVLSTMLKLFFEKEQSRIYDAASSMLNISRLACYSDLTAVASSVNFNTRAFCTALCRCIADLITPPPSILQADENEMTTFHHFSSALQEVGLHTSLCAISLAQNQIKSTDVAVDLKPFSQLREVNLTGNPVTSAADYRQRIKKNLPWLQGLDGQGIATPPLDVPWPRFYDPDGICRGDDLLQDHGDRYYDDTQKAVLHFIQHSVLKPLEREPAAGILSGVDAVSDVYALNATFSFSLSSNNAAVSTPTKTVSTSTQRDVIREIVGFRLRQSESNHNLLLGIKAATVASGRTSVCAKLEHVLYPKGFTVGHYIHSSPDVAVLDNKGFGPNAVVAMKHPISVVTLHGVLIWRYRSTGSDADVANSGVLRDAIVIKRNFSRVLTVSAEEPGRWHVANDMVTLYPFSGAESDADADSSVPLNGNYLFRDIHPHQVVFMPAGDPVRIGQWSRKYGVPSEIVETLCRAINTDLQLAAVLVDLRGVPLSMYEQCAALVNMDPIASIFLCRIGNRFGLEPTIGIQLIETHGLNWTEIERGATAAR